MLLDEIFVRNFKEAISEKEEKTHEEEWKDTSLTKQQASLYQEIEKELKHCTRVVEMPMTKLNMKVVETSAAQMDAKKKEFQEKYKEIE